MYRFVRQLLFLLEPERAHALTLHLMRLVGAAPPAGKLIRAIFAAPTQPVQAFGLTFLNPVGLAAGYDKDGLGWRGLASLGFGHIEIGTVTLRPQAGNPQPRLFRLPQDQALINRMGFPGRGADFVAHQMQGKKPVGLILGVNLGKNKDTPLEKAADDYLALIDIFAPLADYLAINISSPNTIGLRRLQARDLLDELLAAIQQKRQALAARATKCPPILVKLAPDLNDQELDDALDVILRRNMDGVIATNTTLSRQGLRSTAASESGGLSGAPLTLRSNELVRQIHKRTASRIPIIGVGGIMSAADAQAMLAAGASLVQVYTGLVYAGPGLVRQICLSLT